MTIPSSVRADNAGGRGFDERVFTLRHLIDSFLSHVRILVRTGEYEPATERWYTDLLRPLDALEDYPADALRTHHLVTIKLTTGFVRALKRLYRWAAEEELVPRDPFAKLAVPRGGRRERTLTRAELCRLYLRSPRALRRLVYVQIHTIARPGEVRDLTWGQIDWDNRVVVLVEYKGKKRRRVRLSARAIPLPHHVLRFLRNLRRKSPDPSPTGRVFYSTRGGRPWTYNGVRCAMRRARAKAGLDGGDEPVVCYHMRHTAATQAIRNEMPIKILADVMGHARTSTTERYLHLQTQDLVGAVDRAAARRRPRPRAG